MTKRKSNDPSLPNPKRAAVSRFEHQFPDHSRILDNALESLQHCVKNDYNTMIHSSTQALDSLHTTLILSLLDIRAKAHLKRQEYKQSETDASEMIKLAPQSSNGYLRRAEVCIAQEDFDGALEIYERGKRWSDDRNDLQRKIQAMQDILHDKITACVELCKFAQAERYARHWMRLYPSHSNGYICAGDVYMMQGKSQLAIQAYVRSGLLNQAESLMLKFHRVCEQSDRHVDVIADSPFDIVASILPFLSTTSLIECLSVSRTWRTKVAQCRSAWRTIIVPEQNTWLHELKRLHCHWDHVRTLRFDRPEYSRTQFNSAWLTLCTTFNHLETLVIEMYALDLHTLVNGLKMTSATLRRLEISQESKFWQLDDATDHFGPIWTTLSQFQKLTHYSFRDISISSEGFQERTLLPIPTLTHLVVVAQWLSDRDPSSTRRFDTVLRACPGLSYIRTNAQQTGLQAMHQRLSRLNHLCLSTQNKLPDQHFDNPHQLPRNGIRIIKIYTEQFPDAHATFSVLDKHRDTLEHVQLWEICNLHTPITPDDRTDWTLLSSFRSPTLRKFDCGLDRLDQCTILSILHQCPNLETVYFTSTTQLTDAVFDALVRLARLTKLELRDCKKITGEGLADFFGRVETKLKHLHLADMDLSDTYIDPLSKVQLTTLYLNGFADGGPLMTIASRLVSLEQIALRGIKIRVRKAFDALAKLPRLRKVELMELDSVCDEDIVALVDQSNSVRNITAAYCDALSTESIDYANQYITATLFAREE